MRTATHRPSLTHEQLARLCQTGRADALYRPPTQATGYATLDAALPGGGLPVGAVTEIMSSTHGIGELRIVMPALAQLTRTERYVAMIEPPYVPYPPALVQHRLQLERLIVIRAASVAQCLWSSEQLLRCPAFGAVLAWPATINDKELRRLQLAAEASGNLAILYRPIAAAHLASPAALRLLLHAEETLRIEIKKCRGGHAGRIVRCALDTPTDTFIAA